jgi:anti-sigma factor RsiW
MTGELDPETVSAFEEHLRLCPDCVAFLNTYKKTVQVARSLRYESIPPELERRVRRFLTERVKRGHRAGKRS